MVEKEVCCRVPVTTYVCPTTCGCASACNSCCAPAPRAVTTYETSTKKIQVPVCTMTQEKKIIKCCKPVMTCEDKEYEVNVCTMTQQKKTIKCCKNVVTCEDQEYEVNVCKMEQQKKTIKCCKNVVTCEDQEYEVCVCKMTQEKKTIKCCKKVCTMETVTKKVCVPTKITCTEYVMKKRPVTYTEEAPCTTGCATGCNDCSQCRFFLPTSGHRGPCQTPTGGRRPYTCNTGCNTGCGCTKGC
jgi:hypothetical protein